MTTMRRAMKALVLVGVLAVLWGPVEARADGYVSPWAGVNFGNDQAEGDWAFGVNAGAMGAGIIGGELDFGFAPNFFGESVNNHVLNVMGNLIVGVPVGGTSGPGIRPYVTGGLGLIRTSIDSGVSGVDAFTTNDFGFNLGAGAMGFFNDHFGLRGDVRYYRTLNEDSGNDELIDLDLGAFDFWRASIGIVIR
jgi:opacity protein-like surface antigen